jgi:putative glycerol-1-phosphate prenyltransferase
LISGRNPDYLIGHQVKQRQFKTETIEIISTDYILYRWWKERNCSRRVSQTKPLDENLDWCYNSSSRRNAE